MTQYLIDISLLFIKIEKEKSFSREHKKKKQRKIFLTDRILQSFIIENGLEMAKCFFNRCYEVMCHGKTWTLCFMLVKMGLKKICKVLYFFWLHNTSSTNQSFLVHITGFISKQNMASMTPSK